jgi:hypothetical protein
MSIAGSGWASKYDVSQVGPGWFSFFYNSADEQPGDYTVTISNISVPLDVYVMKSKFSDPNQYTYDLKFLGVKSSLKLNTAHFPSVLGDAIDFTVSIYAQGIATK